MKKKYILLVIALVFIVGNVNALLFEWILERRGAGQDNDRPPVQNCNNDGICDIGEGNNDCPNDCPVERTTQTIQPPRTQQNLPIDGVNNLANDRSDNTLFNLVIAVIASIFFIVLVISLWLWLHKSKQKDIEKKKNNEMQNVFGLPRRPQRRFGV
ncbi:MAG: hypothetical protein AABX08_00560 [Nanoarchaeota archaeon]